MRILPDWAGREAAVVAGLAGLALQRLPLGGRRVGVPGGRASSLSAIQHRAGRVVAAGRAISLAGRRWIREVGGEALLAARPGGGVCVTPCSGNSLQLLLPRLDESESANGQGEDHDRPCSQSTLLSTLAPTHRPALCHRRVSNGALCQAGWRTWQTSCSIIEDHGASGDEAGLGTGEGLVRPRRKIDSTSTAMPLMSVHHS